MITTRQNFDLTAMTTFAIPAKCGCFIEYDIPEDIPFILSTLRHDVDFVHIGGGSNLLFTHDFPGVVAHSAIKGIEIVEEDPAGVKVKVGAGEKMDDFIRWACDRELWGVENLSGIPGEVGASAVQNVGAYGSEAADAIVEVNAYDREKGEFVTIPCEECRYGYRDSIFKRPELRGCYIIHSVVYRLTATPSPKIDYPALRERFQEPPQSPTQVRDAVIAVRDSKLPDPADTPSAGSFFKNPVIDDATLRHIIEVEGNESFPHYAVDGGWKIPAAWLIDRCGWKGRREGNVGVWHLQPLVIVNPERKATASEVIALEQRIKDSVMNRYGVTLTPEVEHI
ncbi:UDP-N-acetylmuramate dehydrogenase [Muribaculum intestinale]|uniref:UDP-N-acetylmuramate dehydrogenase n=1 Tax=Muribaculum intestinale TaxID=1796646 RepID=UPI0026F3EF2E|nr:UDP-N-acetylmuramate dehydrogenase [Muribaculum intestinale]